MKDFPTRSLIISLLAFFLLSLNPAFAGQRGTDRPLNIPEEAIAARNTQPAVYSTSFYQEQGPLANPAYNYYLNNSAFSNYSSSGAGAFQSQAQILNKEQELIDRYQGASLKESEIVPAQKFIEPEPGIPAEDPGAEVLKVTVERPFQAQDIE